jgi:hypothetical protein
MLLVLPRLVFAASVQEPQLRLQLPNPGRGTRMLDGVQDAVDRWTKCKRLAGIQRLLVLPVQDVCSCKAQGSLW